ncbi:MAG TPA: hypothetical protein VJW23_10060 [Propionibacteriaceae bacterium]|nr:hypothetical protein [Propionibacteriaceae bacterium]
MSEIAARYVGFCCREWILHVAGRGRCGLCGETPTYLRPWTDDEEQDL